MEQPAGLARLLLARLERISADSRWAHRASGVRGAPLSALEDPAREIQSEGAELNSLLEAGFAILRRAARDRIR